MTRTVKIQSATRGAGRSHSIGALFVATALSSPVLAQTTAPAASARTTLGEIVVTAERHEESLSRVPESVQAFRGGELKRLHVVSTSDLSSVAPSFTVSQAYEGVPIYTLRGIGFNTINLSATSAVGTYTDEVAYAYPFMNVGPIYDLQRVEVLKGPQGTLYGRNTTAGLIDFITNKPANTFGASATAEGGNYGTHNFEGYITGPLADKIQARLAFRTEDSDEGWQHSDTRPGDTQGRVHRYGLRASIAAQPTDRLSIDLSVSGWYDGSDTLVGQAIGFTPTTNPAGPSPIAFFNAPGLVSFVASHPPTTGGQADWDSEANRCANIGDGVGICGPLKENDQFYAGKLRVAYELTDGLKIISLTGYEALNRDAKSDWSGAPYEIFVQHYNGTIRSFAEDLHLEGDTPLAHWIFGGYYSRDVLTDGDRSESYQNANNSFLHFLILNGGGPIPAGGLVNSPFNTFGYTPLQVEQSFQTFTDRGDLTSRTWSVFGSADWNLPHNLKLTTGLRYTDDRQNFSGCSRDYNGNMLPIYNLFARFLYTFVYGGGVPPAPAVANGCISYNPATNAFSQVVSVLDENNLAGRLALSWTPTANTLFYASVTRGAKAGDTPIEAANIVTQDYPAKQELLTAYEVGTKSALFDRRLQLNLAYFYYDYADKQLNGYFADPIYTALARLVNIPKSHAEGVDADVTWRITPNLTATLAGAYLHTEVTKFVGINAAGQSQNFAGSAFPFSPTWSGAATLLYTHPLNDSLGLQAALNYRRQSSSKADLGIDPLYNIRGYGLLNASIGVNDLKNDRWEFSLWGRNLTSTYYWTGVQNDANTVVRFPGEPVTYGATLTIRY